MNELLRKFDLLCLTDKLIRTKEDGFSTWSIESEAGKIPMRSIWLIDGIALFAMIVEKPEPFVDLDKF